ncbi:cellulose-binding family II [Actinobacteria bacterium OK074]|nr:cellulose-binding family II [Actinobacteria bacterium OK074]
MPDLPTPQDAAEAALFSECWDAVLSYADLCTSGTSAGTQLATEAFTHGIHEARAAEAAARSTGRRTQRLPRVPLLLTSVRTTAASWEADGHGALLDPDLRLWLNSEKAARYTGPPLKRPLALRALRDMQELDAALLWLVEVESLPAADVARVLALDPATVSDELTQVRALFRDRCHRNHLDTPMAADCRSYARLLDAVTRSPGTETPEDLSRHLATCVECAEAAACLRLHSGQLPAAVAGGVIGWGGLAYLERRRRAAEAGLHGGRMDAGPDTGLNLGPARPRIGRTGLLTGAVLLSALTLAVSLLQFGGSGGGSAAHDTSDDKGVAVAETTPSAPASDPGTGDASGNSSTSRPVSGASAATSDPDTEPQGDSDATVGGTHKKTGSPTPSETAVTCTVTYSVVNEWNDGFQAGVSISTSEALDDWRVGWTFRDGQRVTQMWDATVGQNGSRVTATAADYNREVAADGSLDFGFLASWGGANTTPYDFTLNGQSCAKAG